jgi:hypothetical protein
MDYAYKRYVDIPVSIVDYLVDISAVDHIRYIDIGAINIVLNDLQWFDSLADEVHYHYTLEE